MNVTLVIGSMNCGGAERVMASLANGLAGLGHQVTLLSNPSAEDEWFFPLNDDVVRSHFKPDAFKEASWKDPGGWLKRLGALRHSIESTGPDVVVSFLDYINVAVLLSLLGSAIPCVVEEHSDPRVVPMRPRWAFVRRLVYPTAACVVVLNDEIEAWAKSFRPKWRTAVIPNPVPPAESGASQGFAESNGLVLASIGRLAPEKRFDRLVDAFAVLADRFQDWNLTIWGEGPEREALQRQIEQLGMSGRISLPGRVEDVYGALETVNLFALTSDVEGFGLSLAEAMSSGVPVVSVDCMSGPRHLVRHGVDGFLTPPGDRDSLIDALARLMGDSTLRSEMGGNALEITQRFHPDKILEQWNQLLHSIQSDRAA